MGGITAGVGIFSGIDTQSLISQLLAIDARPKLLAQRRIAQLQQQSAAYLDVNSALLGLKTAGEKFASSKTFRASAATSSNAELLSASASTDAVPGSYQFIVSRLVSTQQMLSRGFSDRDTTGIGLTSLTLEQGGGALATDTLLSSLNGGSGVQRGKIVITDKSGGTATIDLSSAVSVEDVLGAINQAEGVNVRARVDGDGFAIEDLSGGAGSLTVANAFGYNTAESLGIAGTTTGTILTGTQVRTVTGDTPLALLNDGRGVLIRDATTSLVITDRAGNSVNVSLGELTETTTDPETDETTTTVTQTRASTIQDVLDYINTQAATAGVAVTASINDDGTGVKITDTSGGGGNLVIADAAGGQAASNLGITADAASAEVQGRRILAGLNSTLTTGLLGGSGFADTDFTITDRAGNSATVNLDAASLTGSVTDIINDLNDKLAGAGVLVTVGVNDAGNGLALTDNSGGNGNLVAAGAGAAALKLETAGVASNAFNGGNLQSAWLSRATRLSDLNAGQGLGTGTIRITDAAGGTTALTIGSNIKTIDDLIGLINGSPANVTASINANGDGIQIVDNTGQASGSLRLEDESGTILKRLGIAGTFTEDEGVIQAVGSFERELTFDPSATLDEIIGAINNAGAGVRATIINDGSGVTPYRMSITSTASGSKGRVLIDTQGVDLGLNALAEGRDAVAFFGSGDPAHAIVLTSATNTLDGVVQGVTIDLKRASSEVVEVNVTRDTATIEKDIEDFVAAFNRVLDTVSKYDKYNADTETRGVLLGDSTVNNVRSRLLSAVQGRGVNVSSEFEYLFQVGVKIGTGAKIEFDRDQFREALEADPEGVEQLFSASRLAPRNPIEIAPGITVNNTDRDSYSELGVPGVIADLVKTFTDSVDGLLTTKNKSIDSAIDLQEGRIDQYDLLLASKRSRLEAQFLAMERAIAQMQTQSSALTNFGG